MPAKVVILKGRDKLVAGKTGNQWLMVLSF